MCNHPARPEQWYIVRYFVLAASELVLNFPEVGWTLKSVHTRRLRLRLGNWVDSLVCPLPRICFLPHRRLFLRILRSEVFHRAAKKEIYVKTCVGEMCGYFQEYIFKNHYFYQLLTTFLLLVYKLEI